VWVPFSDAIAALHRCALVDLEPRTVRDAVRRALLTLRIEDHGLHVATHRDQLAVGILHDIPIGDLDLAVVAGLDLRLAGHLRRTTDMERAHRELRAGLADRLRRDDAHSFADVHRRSAREIATVALAADAIRELTGKYRAHAHLLDMRGFDLLGDILGDLAA